MSKGIKFTPNRQKKRAIPLKFIATLFLAVIVAAVTFAELFLEFL